MSQEKQLKVLIAADDDAMRFAICRVIDAEGYTSIAASDGEMAIDLYQKDSPDVVLLDTLISKKNAYQVCQRLREDVPDIHSLPIIITTEMDDDFSLARAQEVGASDYLVKPLRWPLLIYRINMLLLQRRLFGERKRLEGRLRQTHRLNALRQLTAGFAHDFNNILATQLGYTELALNSCQHEGDRLNQYLGEVQKASLRGKLLIEQLMTFAMDEMELTSAYMINDAFRESIKSMQKTLPDKINLVSMDDSSDSWIPLNSVQFHSIVLNLVENAIDALANEGEIRLSLVDQELSHGHCTSCMNDFSGSYVVLICEDGGSGIQTSIHHKIFEPFYTTKEVGQGTGHGLSVIHGIVHAAGGHIQVESEVGAGCIIKIFFKPISATNDGRVVEI